MLKWLATNPVGWAILATGAIATFIGLVNHFAITAEKLNEQLQELKATEEELISTQNKLTEIDGKIAEIKSKGTLSITDKADISRLEQERLLLEDEIELLKLKKELQQDEYNKNAKKYADGQYSNYMGGQVGIAAVINNYKGYKEKSERTDVDDYFVENAKRGLKETKTELVEYRNTINENLANLAPDDEESRKKLETIREAIEKLIYTEEELAKIKFDRFIIDPNNSGVSKGFEKIKSDGEVTTQEIADLANKFPTLKKFMDDSGISAETLAAELSDVGTEAENSGANTNELATSLAELEKASDNIKPLGTAFKELSDDGYITIKTLKEMKDAADLSSDEWTEYEAKLLKAKVGSSEFNQIMSDLTYKILDNTFAGKDLNAVTEQQIAAVLRENGVVNATAVAHDWLTSAKVKAKLTSFNFTTATAEETKVLYQELKAIGLTEVEVKNLATVYASAQKAMLEAVESGAAGRLGILKSELEGIAGIAEAYALLGKGYDTNGDGTIDYAGTEIGRMSPEQKAKYQADRAKIIAYGNAVEALKKIEDIDVTIPNYSGAAKGSGSDKNEALDNYLKDAENRYKIHQDETKYIEELQYAHDNLTKDEKERLDIVGKINEAYRDLANNRIKDIEHQIDLAKELNGENVDVTAYYRQIQNVAREEANRLRAIGYDDNSNEIQDLQKTWWDAQKSISEWDWNNSNDWIDKRNEKGDWALYGDSEYEAWQRVVKWLREKYPNEVEKIHEATQKAIDARWENSNNWISDRNTYNDWELFDDSEVDAWERVVKWLKEEYPDELGKIKEAEQNLFEARKDAMEKSISDIDDYINARNTYNDWEAYGDTEVKAIQRQTKIIEKAYKDRLLSYEEYVDRLEEQSQRIYSLAQDEIDKQLSNIDKYISARNHYNDWDEFGDSEIEAIKRQIQYLDAAYKQKLISYEDYTERVAEYTQKLYSVAKDNIVEEVSELIKDYEKMKSLESSQLESQKTLLQSYYDVTNAIAEAQHEINKELKASMTMYEYLNEETRELLFNQEDFNVLNEELLEIQSAADALQKQYQEDILNASAETIAEITSQYQMQYATMMKQYEIAKAELDVAKKRQQLDNVLAERNTRMFINGQWQWVAKTQDVINAQNELAEAEIERKKQEASLEQTEAINDFTAQINSLETDLSKVRKWWSDMQEMLDGESDEVAKALQEISQVSSPELKRVIEATGGSIDSFSTSLSVNTKTMSNVINENLNGVTLGVSGFISNLRTYSNAITDLANKISGAKSSSGYSSPSASDIKTQMAANSAAWHTASTQAEKDALHQANVDLAKQLGLDEDDYNSGTGKWNYHAAGTRYTPGGLTALGEDGFEAYITNNGRLIPINQPTIGNIGAGGIVFNREQMAGLRTLWDWSNIGKISPVVSSSNANSQNTVIDNSIHINGLTISEQGNEDWINGLKRYVATHK